MMPDQLDWIKLGRTSAKSAEVALLLSATGFS